MEYQENYSGNNMPQSNQENLSNNNLDTLQNNGLPPLQPKPPQVAQAPVPQVSEKLPSTWEMLKETFSIYKKNFALIAILFLIPFFLETLLPNVASIFFGIDNPLKVYNNQEFPLLPVLLALITTLAVIVGVLLRVFGSYGLIKGLPEMQSGNKETLGELYGSGAKVVFPVLWIGFLVGMVTFSGFIILIIPAILFSVYLSFSAYARILDEKKGLNALVYSWGIVKGKWIATAIRTFLSGLLVSLPLLIIVPLFFVGTYFAFGLNTGDTISDSFFNYTEQLNRLDNKDNETNQSDSIDLDKNNNESEVAIDSNLITHYKLSGIFTNLIIILYYTPIMIIFSYVLYVNLKKRAVVLDDASRKRKNWLRFFIVMGIIFVLSIPVLVVSLASLISSASMSKTGEIDLYAPQYGFQTYEDYRKNAPSDFIELNKKATDLILEDFDGNNREASDSAIEIASNYSPEDYNGTLNALNGAWTLDPSNYKVYWAFGSLLKYSKGDATSSLQWYEKAINSYANEYELENIDEYELLCQTSAAYFDVEGYQSSRAKELANSIPNQEKSFSCLLNLLIRMDQFGVEDELQNYFSLINSMYPDEFRSWVEANIAQQATQ